MIWLQLILKKAEIALAGVPIGEILWALFSMSSLAALLRSIVC